MSKSPSTRAMSVRINDLDAMHALVYLESRGANITSLGQLVRSCVEVVADVSKLEMKEHMWRGTLLDASSMLDMRFGNVGQRVNRSYTNQLIQDARQHVGVTMATHQAQYGGSHYNSAPVPPTPEEIRRMSDEAWARQQESEQTGAQAQKEGEGQPMQKQGLGQKPQPSPQQSSPGVDPELLVKAQERERELADSKQFMASPFTTEEQTND